MECEELIQPVGEPEQFDDDYEDQGDDEQDDADDIKSFRLESLRHRAESWGSAYLVPEFR
jgi:hypothetical protein